MELDHTQVLLKLSAPYFRIQKLVLYVLVVQALPTEKKRKAELAQVTPEHLSQSRQIQLRIWNAMLKESLAEPDVAWVKGH